jgi:hypothetical protein
MAHRRLVSFRVLREEQKLSGPDNFFQTGAFFTVTFSSHIRDHFQHHNLGIAFRRAIWIPRRRRAFT